MARAGYHAPTRWPQTPRSSTPWHPRRPLAARALAHWGCGAALLLSSATLIAACTRSRTRACAPAVDGSLGADASPDADTAFDGVDPSCAPLSAAERCTLENGCLGGYREVPEFVPVDFFLPEGGDVLYLTVQTGYDVLGPHRTDEGYFRCSKRTRYRIGLRDGVVAVVGSHCIAPDESLDFAERVASLGGWAEYSMCTVLPEQDLELRMVPAGVRSVFDTAGCSVTEHAGGETITNYPLFPQPCLWSSRPAVAIRRHSTGELLAALRLPPAQMAECMERVVSLVRDGPIPLACACGDPACTFSSGLSYFMDEFSLQRHFDVCGCVNAPQTVLEDGFSYGSR